MKSLVRALAGIAALVAAVSANAQELPFQGPIKIVAGFAAGGSSDSMARVIAEKLEKSLGRPVIIENKVGAGGRIAAESVKNAPADGSQILLGNTVVMSLAPIVFRDLRYDPLKDFVLIGKAAEYQLVVATGEMTQAKTLPELLAWAKAHPNQASYGVPAAGSLPHLYALQVADKSKVPMTMVPYRGGAPMAKDLISGHLPMAFSATSDFSEQHRAGLLRIVALSGTKRHPALPDVPTFAEQGIAGVEENGWNGFFLPAGTPPGIVERYTTAIADALRDKAVVERLENLGFLVEFAGGENLSRQIAAEQEKWAPVVKDANLVQ